MRFHFNLEGCLLNLYDFEDRISSKIIGRGYDYYISEAIVSVEYDDKKNYILNVNGSREYSVEISLDRKSVV